MSLLEEKYMSHPMRTCYASADDDLFTSNIVVWICGHGHRAKQWKKEGDRPEFVMNARGYPSEMNRATDVYNPEASIFVKN
jgi:hypothetical protein